jgi:hypothetical protein
MVFVYVILMSFVFPASIYYWITWWLPIRLDYLGESSFVLSFIFAFAGILTGEKNEDREIPVLLYASVDLRFRMVCSGSSNRR